MISKNSSGLFTLLGILFLISCSTSEKKLGNFEVLPAPQQFEITGISGIKHNDVKNYFTDEEANLPVHGNLLNDIQRAETSSKAQVVFKVDESLDIKQEGYLLEIAENQISITGKDKAGLLYGFMTLVQLMEDAKEQNVNLPICKIKDFPSLSFRAIHIDIKHHLEKLDYYYQLMDRLAKYKVNAIILEVEDKIKYERQPKIGSEDALSIEEWKKLSNYAKERNIEISPLVQGLGHASFILKHDEYKKLRDDPKSDWAFDPLNAETYKVQFDLYMDAIAATPHGKYLHIGGDEVHTTGRESGKSSLELQLIWLNKVCAFAEKEGRIPIFWDDMPLKYAKVYSPMFDTKITKEEVDNIWKKNESNLLQFIDQFPKNCIYMRWNYHAPETYGNLKAMDWFTSNGFKSMGATAGQTRWVLMPQRKSNIENIKSFALSSIEKGLDGLLLTLWDDDSPHFELYIRGIMAFAEYTWAGKETTTEEFKSMHMQRAFGFANSDSLDFIDQLEKPVSFWKNALVEKGANRNNLIKNSGVGVIEIPNPKNRGKWSEKYAERLVEAKNMLQICNTISAEINKAKKAASRNQYTLEVYEQVNELVKFSCQILLELEKYDQQPETINEEEAKKNLEHLVLKFSEIRFNFETVYSKTRKLTKPDNYLLDQDHHRHSANQSISFDWQFVSEIFLLENLSN